MKMRIISLRRLNQAGMSLVELLVATTIGLILLGGIYQVFISSDTGYRYNEQLARLQENGRFVLELMTRDGRMAGYWGCAGQTDSFTSVLNSTDFIYDFGQAVYGLEATGANLWSDDAGLVDPTSTLGSGMGLSNPVNGSDILVIRGIDPDIRIEATGHMDNVSSDLKITAGLSDDVLDPNGGEILVVTDCVEATVFQSVSYTDSNGNLVHNTGASVTPGNSTFNFGHPYQEDAEILFPRTTVYYLRYNGNNEPSLYRKIANSAVEELIEGVESMQILYGEDTDDNRTVDVYNTANSVGDWDNVLAVRIGLLLRSPGEIAKKDFDALNYTVNGTVIDPMGNGTPAAPVDDRRLRQVFTTTVGIRNRLP